MKRILFLILFALPIISFSQQETVLHYQKIDQKAFHFGYTLGINTMDFAVYPSDYSLKHDIYPEVNKLSPGVDIGIVTNFRLSKYLDFRVLPGISLGQRNLLYYENVNDGIEGNEEVIGNDAMKLGSTFINVPFLLRYEAKREKNYRPYLILGTNLRWDMARNKDFNVDEGIYVKLDPFDIYLEGGFGIDFYLPYFKLSPEIKFSVGVLNILSPDAHDEKPEYVESIDKLKSRMVSLSFHFE